MTQVPSEGPETAGQPERVPDGPGDQMAEDRELKQDEAAQRSGDAAEPDQPWT